MTYSKLLRFLARIPPEAFDAIFPHGPAVRIADSRVGRVAFTPQPDPPGRPFLAGVADVAHEITRIAVSIDAQGGSASSFLQEVIDDFCGNGWPRKFPRRRPDEPDPDPWDMRMAQVIAAVVFAHTAARLPDGELGKSLDAGADQLVEAAIAA